MKNSRYNILNEYEYIKNIILKGNDNESIIRFFLKEMIDKSNNIISSSDKIILLGATPFACNVYKERKKLFPNAEVELIDNEMDVRGGGTFILCSRPNVEKHIAWVKNTDDASVMIMYQYLLLLHPELSMEPFAYTYSKIIQQITDIIINFKKYEVIIQELGDALSKEIFARMLIYRLTYDPVCHINIKTKYRHYFDEDIIFLSKNENFVDCGGFNGDTLHDFKKQTNDAFSKYYLFEPDENLIAKAINLNKNDIRCIFVNKGVWDKEDVLLYKSETSMGNGTIVMNNRSKNIIKIPVTKIDNVVERATFIKMDVEGSELKALQGAKKTICTFHPKLAICVYHKYQDYIELYESITRMMPYKIYLRAQYDNIDMETYYLCIPN